MNSFGSALDRRKTIGYAKTLVTGRNEYYARATATGDASA